MTALTEVRFTTRWDEERGAGFVIPLQPWPQTFMVSRALECTDAVELVPLTLTGFFRAIAKNFVTMNLWRVRRVLWRLGFVDVPVGASWEGGVWRWRFWAPRIGHQP